MDLSADSGQLSGRVTSGSATHRGLLKPPATGTPPPAAGSSSAGSFSAGSDSSTAPAPATPPDVPLGKQISAALPGLLTTIGELGGVMADLKGAVSKNDDKLDRLLNFMMGTHGAAAAPAPAPEPAHEPAPANRNYWTGREEDVP